MATKRKITLAKTAARNYAPKIKRVVKQMVRADVKTAPVGAFETDEEPKAEVQETQESKPVLKKVPVEDAARALLAECPANYAESQWRPSPASIAALKQALE